MSRNYVICCDGTNNQFGPQNTNVVRLVQALDRDPAKQRLYYDPGVGTLPEPGALTRLRKWLSKIYGLAFGAGLTWKVEEAYSYLMDFWEPGDRVFLFGFSRGAYTARVLAGLLHTLGLMPRGNQNLVPYAMRLFKAVRSDLEQNGAGRESGYWKLCEEFRRTFARPIHEGDESRRFRAHFLGVWDTVSSVGWIWDPVKFPFTRQNPSIDVVRHAVSVDERRCLFRQNLMQKAEREKEGEQEQDFKELWFAGVHSDVGGGYPEREGGLWRAPFEWMLGEAMKAGLMVNKQRLHAILQKTSPSDRFWAEPQHESLKGVWWPVEFIPTLVWRADLRRRVPQIGLGRHRHIHRGAVMHKSTLLRIRDNDLHYAPPNFSGSFVKKVRELQEAPETFPYEQ
jgi:uncharacterized protein (DUF2235 family)